MKRSHLLILVAAAAVLTTFVVVGDAIAQGYIFCSNPITQCNGTGCFGDRGHFMGCDLECFFGEIPSGVGDCHFIFPV